MNKSKFAKFLSELPSDAQLVAELHMLPFLPLSKKEFTETYRILAHNITIRFEQVHKEIEDITKKVNKVHLLNYALDLVEFQNGLGLDEDSSQEYYYAPLLHNLAGVCLSDKKIRGRPLSIEEWTKLYDLINNYATLYMGKLLITKRDSNPVVSDLLLNATLLDQITGYRQSLSETELLKFINSVFVPLNETFYKNYGFRVENAYTVGAKMLPFYRRKVKETIAFAEEAVQKTKEKIAKKEIEINKILKGSKMSEAQYLKAVYKKNLFLSIRKSFDFHPISFIVENKLSDNLEEVLKYLKTISCEFGSNKNYYYPSDSNILYKKPIININGYYMCPVPRDLTQRLPELLHNLLEEVKKSNKDPWQRYITLRSKYCEEYTYDLIKFIFKDKQIYRNLFYRFNNVLYEIDLLVLHNNQLIVFECKSGKVSGKAKKGNKMILRKSLKELVDASFRQANRVELFLNSSKEAIFTDKKGNPIIRLKKEKIDSFILINSTLTNISPLVFSPKRLTHLDLFKESSEYIWSVNIYDLKEIIRRSFSPDAFIDYIKQRLIAQKEDVFTSIREIDYFEYYKMHGDFSTAGKKGEHPFILLMPKELTTIL